MNIKMNEINRTFKVDFNSNSHSNFYVQLTKESSSIPLKIEEIDNVLNSTVDISSNTIEADTDINNSSEDTWYDEVIFYDGGGVEGYGY